MSSKVNGGPVQMGGTAGGPTATLCAGTSPASEHQPATSKTNLTTPDDPLKLCV